jgi:hypothetical protein
MGDHRGAHRHRAAGRDTANSATSPIRSSASLSCRSAASIEFRHQVGRLEPGTLGRRLRIDLEDDCSGLPNTFWTLVPRLRASAARASKAPDAARAMIKFMTSPEVAPLLRKTYVEPARR